MTGYTKANFPQLDDKTGARNAVRQAIANQPDWERTAEENGFPLETRNFTKDTLVFGCNVYGLDVRDVLRNAGIEPRDGIINYDDLFDGPTGDQTRAENPPADKTPETADTPAFNMSAPVLEKLSVMMAPALVEEVEAAIQDAAKAGDTAARAEMSETVDELQKDLKAAKHAAMVAASTAPAAGGNPHVSAGNTTAAQAQTKVKGVEPLSSIYGWGTRTNAMKTFGPLETTVYDCPSAPPVDSDYLFPVDAVGLITATWNRDKAVWLWGPAGTGKSTLAEQMAARTGAHFCRIGFADGADMLAMIGQRVLEGDGSGGTNLVWRDGALLQAIRTPGAVIALEEISFAQPGDLAVIQTMLDFRRVTVSETGEVVPFAPGVRVIATDNTDGYGDETGRYLGTNQQNEAFLSRFARKVKLERMSDRELIQMIETRAGCHHLVATACADIMRASERAADTGDISSAINNRAIVAFAQDIADGLPAKLAFETAVLATLPGTEREAAAQQLNANGLTDDAWRALQMGRAAEIQQEATGPSADAAQAFAQHDAANPQTF